MLLNKHSVILKIDIHLLADGYTSDITLKQQKIQCTYLLDQDHHVTGRIGLVKLLTQPQIRQGFFFVVFFTQKVLIYFSFLHKVIYCE